MKVNLPHPHTIPPPASDWEIELQFHQQNNPALQGLIYKIIIKRM